MENNLKNRREFFKEAAKKTLPILGMAVMATIAPSIMQSCTKSLDCVDACTNACQNTCRTTCVGGCSKTCTGNCDTSCKGDCNTTCSGTCWVRCQSGNGYN